MYKCILCVITDKNNHDTDNEMKAVETVINVAFCIQSMALFLQVKIEQGDPVLL